MMGLIKRHQELCEEYYDTFGEHVPFELAWQTLEYRINWIEAKLKSMEDSNE